MLSRALQWYGYELPEGGITFADEETISSWALADVIAMSGIGTILGYEDNTFRPGNTATRSQAATVMLRAYDYVMTTVLPEIPVDPEQPVDPEESVDPEDPVDPELPTEPEDPTDTQET